MRRLLSNKWVQFGGTIALTGLYWVCAYLWSRIDNAAVEGRVQAVEVRQAEQETKAKDDSDNLHHVRDRVDAIYDFLLNHK